KSKKPYCVSVKFASVICFYPLYLNVSKKSLAFSLFNLLYSLLNASLLFTLTALIKYRFFQFIFKCALSACNKLTGLSGLYLPIPKNLKRILYGKTAKR
ncbi:MAG: hypothetical protein LE178_02665, partial [Endomicrobium sp.]|nr:hypothetical protein [Endomicrobium sp.]